MEEVVAAATTRPTTASHELVPQLQFPPGFHFVPTEEELVDVYLRAKIEGRKLPLEVVNDVDILQWQPGSLIEKYKGYGENRWWFFTVREQSSSNKEKEPSRKVKVPGVTATWKATGSVQLIGREKSKVRGGGGDNAAVVGTKRVLIYNSTDPNENGKWSMHEYILEGHAEIGQYALYSIQRKQHSDTEDNAGNDDDMDPEKKKKTRKRKRADKPRAEPEGVQLPHPETTTLLAEPPLKPTRRRTKAQRKKKPASMQVVGVEGEQQQQQQLPMEPITPPKKDELAPRQLEGRQPAPAPVVLSAVPLQAVRVCPPSEPDGTLIGASAPTPEEDTLDDAQLWALLYGHNDDPAIAMLCNDQGQEQWPSSSLTDSTAAFLAAPDTSNAAVDHAPLQPQPYYQDGYGLFAMQNQHLSLGEDQSVYMEQGWQHGDLSSFLDLLDDNTTTQPMNSGGGGGWEHGGDQRHQMHQHLASGENQSVYMEQEWQHADPSSFLLDTTTTTQPMNSGGWEQPMNHQILHHQEQQQQQNNGGGSGAVEEQQQQPMNHPQDGHDAPPSDEQSSGSDDLQVDDSLLFGESGAPMDEHELDAFVKGVLVPGEEAPQDLAMAAAGTQEQGADGEELRALLRLGRNISEHVRDGPCACMICARGLRHYFPEVYSSYYGSTSSIPNYISRSSF